MATYEDALIQKVATHGGAEILISHGVDESHFSDSDNKAVWNFLVKHIRKYKTSPSFDLVKESFPKYHWEIVTDPLQYVEDQFIIGVKRKAAVNSFDKLAKIIDTNDEEQIAVIDEIFLGEAKDLAQIVPSSNVSKFSEMKDRIELYRAKKEEGLPIGLPFGIPKLDELTLGLQEHEYVTIAGWTGVGKTTLALLFAINHYVEGYTPMIISLEMGADELYRRLDSIAAGIRQHSMKALTLSPNEMKRWELYADKVDRAKEDIVVVDVDFATPEKVYAETARWNPDVVIVDYIQLLMAPKEYRNIWERIGYCSQMMKAMARQLRIPVYALAQTNTDSAGQGARLDNLAGSRDIGKHSDIVLALNQDEEMSDINKMDIRVEKNRGGPKATIEMYWDQAQCNFREWNRTDAFGAVDNNV